MTQSLITQSSTPPVHMPRPLDYWLLWFVALSSLAINVFLIRTLLGVRTQVGDAASRAAVAIGDLRESAIDYTVTVEKSIPVQLSIPVSTTVIVPINATIPIDTQVTVPLQTPFGEIPVTIPVQTTIPISLQTEVPVSTTVSIDTTIPVALEVPIHLALAETSFGEALQSAQDYLEKLATQLQKSLLPSK
jgi:hypothetical protein